MSDFYSVDPQGWEYDLQSVYSAYMGYFQLHAVPWYDQPWGQPFESFQQFLAFSWPVVTVTDACTGRAHIVTRMSSIIAFVRMIRTRFGETLPKVDNMLLVEPLETSQRHMKHVSEWSAYKKLHATLPAVALAAFKARVRAGDPAAIRELWTTRDKAFLALDFEFFEKNGNRNNGNGDGGDRSPSSSYVTVTEWGYAVIRSSHLVAAGAWPPVPDENYRKGHYVISERATSNLQSDGNERAKSPPPSVSWQYAFGNSQVVSKAELPRIIRCILSLLSPDSESVANNVVLVGHGVHTVLQRLEEMKIKLPSNVLVVDVAYLERALYNAGERGPMVSRKTGAARMPESLLTLGGVLHALGIPLPSKGCALHNAGNDAYMTLVAFQRMVDTRGGMGVGGEPGVLGTAARVGMGAGVKGERASGDADASGQGRGHVMRAATVAARFFRTGNGNKNTSPPSQAQTQVQNRKGQMRTANQPLQSWVSVPGADELGMVVHPPSSKRASMMSTRTTSTTATTMTANTMATAKSAVTVKTSKPSKTLLPRFRWGETGAGEKVNEKENEKQDDNDKDNGHDNEKASTNGSGSGSGTSSVIHNGTAGWWIPPLAMSASMSMSTSPPSSLRVHGPGAHPYQWRHSTFAEMQRL